MPKIPLKIGQAKMLQSTLSLLWLQKDKPKSMELLKLTCWSILLIFIKVRSSPISLILMVIKNLNLGAIFCIRINLTCQSWVCTLFFYSKRIACAESWCYKICDGFPESTPCSCCEGEHSLYDQDADISATCCPYLCCVCYRQNIATKKRWPESYITWE